MHRNGVSLAECLEVRGENLKDHELWALLREALQSMSDAFYNEDIETLSNLVPITPDSLLILSNGTTHLIPSHKFSAFYEECMPPEFIDKVTFNLPQLEKIVVYSLGMIIYTAADYNLPPNQSLEISEEMDRLLHRMCLKDPRHRTNINEALMSCRDRVGSVWSLMDLHHMVLGGVQRATTTDTNSLRFKSSVYSSIYSNPSTLHYILLDPDKETSFKRNKLNNNGNNDTIYDTQKSMLPSTRSIAIEKIDKDLDSIESVFQRLNERRKKLRAGFEGSYRPEDEDAGYGSCRPTLNKSTPNLYESSLVTQEDYDWLDQKAREIELWRSKYLDQNEIIIMPEPTTLNMPGNNRRDEASLESLLLDHAASNDPISGGHAAVEKLAERVSLGNVDNQVEDHRPEKDTPFLSRKFYGPEFHQTHTVDNLIVREASLVSESRLRKAKVKLLNGTEVNVACCPENTTQQLFDCLAAYVQLQQQNYFGLASMLDDELVFLKSDSKLKKNAHVDWTNKKKFTQISALVLYLCVQYYPPDIADLRNQSTRHLLYLQLRQSLLRRHFQITDQSTNMELAALALHAEYGPDNLPMVSKASLQDYLPEASVEEVGKEQAMKILLRKYSRLTKHTQYEAENVFIKMCMRQSEYGYHFYGLSNDPKLKIMEKRWVGVGLKGAVISEVSIGGRSIIKSLPWQSISKISFNRFRFSVTTNSRIKHNYFSDSFKKCRYLLNLCADQHAYELRNMRMYVFDEKPDLIYNPSKITNRINGSQKFTPLATNNKTKKATLRNSLSSNNINNTTTNMNNQPSSYSQNNLNYIPGVTQNDSVADVASNKGEDPASGQYFNRHNAGTSSLKRESNNLQDVKAKDESFEEVDNIDYDVMPNQRIIADNFNKENPKISLPSFNLVGQNQPRQPSYNTKPAQNIQTSQDTQPSYNTKPSQNTQLPNTSNPPTQTFNNQPTNPPAKEVSQPKLNKPQPSTTLPKPQDVKNIIATRPSTVKNPQETQNSFQSTQLPRFFSTNELNTLVEENEPKNEETVKPPPKQANTFSNVRKTNNQTAETTQPATLPRKPPTSIPLLKPSSQPKSTLQFKKVAIKVNLKRNPPEGFGIGLARDRSQQGVFVVSVLAGGVAQRDASMKAGDQITMVNGEDMRGEGGYEKTVQILSKTSEATLELERVVPKIPSSLSVEGTAVNNNNNNNKKINNNNNNYKKNSFGDKNKNNNFSKTNENEANFGIQNNENNNNNNCVHSSFDSTTSSYEGDYTLKTTNPQFNSGKGASEAACNLNGSINSNTNYNELDDEATCNEFMEVSAGNKTNKQDNTNINEDINRHNNKNNNNNNRQNSSNKTFDRENSNASSNRYSFSYSHKSNTFTTFEKDENKLFNFALDNEVISRTQTKSNDIFNEVNDNEMQCEYNKNEIDEVVMKNEAMIQDDDEEEDELLYYDDDDDFDGYVVIDRCKELPRLPEVITEQFMNDVLLSECKEALRNSQENETYGDNGMEMLLVRMKEELECMHPTMEFKSLQTTSKPLPDSCSVGRASHNRNKNRYQNVLPYDSNRVTLQGKQDYINASHIHYQIPNSTSPAINMILSQTPMDTTVGHFWALVWEQEIGVVLMTSALLEDSKHKSALYCPHRVLVVNQYHVKQLECLESPDFELKFLQLTNLSTGESRLVSHLNLLTWKHLDHDPLPLIKYVSLVDILKGDKGVLVQCSTGCSRSAVVVVVYLALKHIVHGIEFDLKEVIKDLRTQRAGSIQNQNQFELCCKSILTALSLLTQK